MPRIKHIDIVIHNTFTIFTLFNVFLLEGGVAVSSKSEPQSLLSVDTATLLGLKQFPAHESHGGFGNNMFVCTSLLTSCDICLKSWVVWSLAQHLTDLSTLRAS